jgi:hypothetical protein
MSANAWIIRKPAAWPALFRSLEAVKIPTSGLAVTCKPATQDRSLDQNAISHVWYASIAKTEKEYTPQEIKWRCKYHFAIPLLRENIEYSTMIDKILGPLEYEDRIRAMEYLRASSLLTKDQMTDYLSAIQHHYAGRVQLE